MTEQLNENIMIYGRQPVYEALRSKQKVVKIWMAMAQTGKIMHSIQKLAEQKNVDVEFIDKNRLQKLVGAVVHQGIAAEVSYSGFLSSGQFEAMLNVNESLLLLILDQIQDPHNLGAIIRTAEISGVDCIILPEKGSAQINATVAKTSAGAVFNIKLHQTDNLDAMMDYLQQKNIRIYATTPSAERSIFEENFNKSTAILIGSEGQGVRKNLLRLCRNTVSIPMYGRTNSLNASVSTAIVLYEIVRQRHFGNQA